MIWNSQSGYVRYVSAEENIKNFLGISQLDYYLDDHKHLAPYLTFILEYLCKKLIEIGIDSDIKDKITLIQTLFHDGTEEIIHCETLNLVREIGISTVKDETETDYVPFIMDRFIFCWSNLLTSLLMRLKFQYAYLYTQEYDGECCKCGAKGQTEADYESWTSNVFPDDEEYDRTNYDRTNSAWQTSKDKYCNCYRESSSSTGN